MSLKNIKVQIGLLLALVLCVGVYFWYTGVYRPLLEVKQEKAQEFYKLKGILESAKQKAAQRVSLEQESEELQKQWQVVETLLPRERDMSDFIQQLHHIRGKVDATVERVSPLPAQTVDFYMVHPYEVEMLTTYHDLGRFFSNVANLPVIVDVSDLDIMALPQEEGEEEEATEVLKPTISCRFSLTTYSLSEEIKVQEEGQ